MVTLLALFAVGVLVTGFFALRNRVVFKMAARNITRHGSQSALIVVGLMLATLLFSAAFTTGDTLTHSVRALVIKELGEVDVVVHSESPEVSGRPAYFDSSIFDTIRQALDGHPDVEGVAPLIIERAPVVAPATRQSEPRVSILGMDAQWMARFSPILDRDGQTLSLGALGLDEILISEKAADNLDAGIGDTVEVYLSSDPATYRVAGVYDKGGNPADKLSLVMPLSRVQTLTGMAGEITSVIVTNVGDAFEGVEGTKTVLAALKPVLEGTGLKASPVKQDSLNDAEDAGTEISTVFFIFAQFSIAAGILLIFLIFVMLAAERKRELGISRAVGAQRGHIVRMFTFEGALYALVAAAVGSLLGVAVGLGMVRILGVALSSQDFEVAFAFHWRSVVVAYTLGMVITFAVVLISSWRVSKLNIVRAVRDLPEPRSGKRSLKGLIAAVLLPILGAGLAFMGYDGAQASLWMLGTSLVIIGVPLVGLRLGLRERVAYSIAGGGLAIWWLLPFDTFEALLPDMSQGIEMFFLSGIMMVIGAVWVAVYNADLMLSAALRLLGRFPTLAPVLRTAVAYPLHSRLRTGLTLAMFSLIVFTLTVMGFVITADNGLFESPEELYGGYHIRTFTNPANPIADVGEALESADGVAASDFAAIGSYTWGIVDFKQVGTNKDPVEDWALRGVDIAYTDSVTWDFAMMADGYNSPRDVWQALQSEPDTVIVDDFLVQDRNNFCVGDCEEEFQLEGFFLQDDRLPEVHLLAHDPRTGSEKRLRVIGVLNPGSFNSGGIIASHSTLNALMGQVVPFRGHMFRLNADGDANTLAKGKAKDLEAALLEHGMQAEAVAEEVRENAETERVINMLIEGFMGLGLVVGIAALGVIAARSVVERRHQIGVLRALGFQKGMVQLSFLLESSFIALLGTFLGVFLGMILSYNLIQEISKDVDFLVYDIPWLNIALVVVIAYVASLLTTFLPARQAARVYPAEALRFE